MKNCTLLWREADLDVKMLKTPQCWSAFGSSDVQKSARHFGAKHISKSKCTKHTRFGPLLEVEMMKKCMALWDEAHFNVKMCKVQEVGSIFGS